MAQYDSRADFTIPVLLDKEYTVYVRKRPFLHEFLERVSKMFEIIIFTASKKIYAEKLLDVLDPDKKLFSRRLYRDSCIYQDGTFTKDLTVLGIDLAKVAIVDNSPQVFHSSSCYNRFLSTIITLSYNRFLSTSLITFMIQNIWHYIKIHIWCYVNHLICDIFIPKCLIQMTNVLSNFHEASNIIRDFRA